MQTMDHLQRSVLSVEKRMLAGVKTLASIRGLSIKLGLLKLSIANKPADGV